MPQMQNRVQETTTTGGTGTLTLSGAVTGYITFASGFSTGASLFYTVDNGVGEWEIGIGTLVTTGTLSRVTVIASSNGGALVNFGSGTKRVFCSAPTRSLVPDQDSNSGKVLTTDGTNPAWTTTLNGITIGNLTAAAGAFTTLSASSTVSGTGFSTYLASPPAIGGTAAAAGAFTTLSASSTVSGTGFSTYLASPPAIGGSSPAAGSFTTLTTSSTVTLNGGTANGVGYLNASKVLTTGTALTFDGTNLGVGTTPQPDRLFVYANSSNSAIFARNDGAGPIQTWATFGTEQARITSNGLGIGYTSLTGLGSNGLAVAGNVGIGTSSPGARLQVNFTTNPTVDNGAGLNTLRVYTDVAFGADIGGALSLGGKYNATTELVAFGQIAGRKENATSGNLAGYIGFSTLNSAGTMAEKMRLDSSGNLGLGVTPSAWSAFKALELNGGAIASSASTNITTLQNAYYNGSSWVYKITNTAMRYDLNSSGHSWYTAASGTAGNAISFTQAMTLTAAGDLGIGAASPLQKLDVRGRVGIYGASDAYQLKLSYAAGTSGFWLGSPSADTLAFYNDAGTERACIDSSGRFAILANTTQYSQDAGLTVNGTGLTRAIFVNINGTGAATQISFGNGNGVVGSITTSGSATSYNTSSDQRLKTNVAPAGSAVESILNFPVDQFDWIASEEHQDFGAVAQKAIHFIPEMVHAPADEDEMWGIDWSKAVPRLIKTVQELHAEIELLKQRIA